MMAILNWFSENDTNLFWYIVAPVIASLIVILIQILIKRIHKKYFKKNEPEKIKKSGAGQIIARLDLSKLSNRNKGGNLTDLEAYEIEEEIRSAPAAQQREKCDYYKNLQIKWRVALVVIKNLTSSFQAEFYPESRLSPTIKVNFNKADYRILMVAHSGDIFILNGKISEVKPGMIWVNMEDIESVSKK